jgi:uncharacterized protein affecting Mg2+/Co2+ transport
MEVFFSRPGSKKEIKERLLTDIKYATKKLLVAAYYFTDEDIAYEIKHSKAHDKRIVYNYNNSAKLNSLFNDKELISKISAPLGNNYSNMHHKFIITDNTLWTGTYNLSFNAESNNWENMLRIQDERIVKQFIEEFDKMFVFSKAINSNLNQNTCTKCKNIVEDPFEHFKITYRVLYKNFVTIESSSAIFKKLIDAKGRIKEIQFANILGDYTVDKKEKHFEYYSECILNRSISDKWGECNLCKQKGLIDTFHNVLVAVQTNFKIGNQTTYKIGTLKKASTDNQLITSCLKCFHNTIVEFERMNTYNSECDIPINVISYSEDP